ncbi:4263_t:CDS:2, partial [Gigaspora margarita]
LKLNAFVDISNKEKHVNGFWHLNLGQTQLCQRLDDIRLKENNYALEINIKFTHNHVIKSAESLSFRRVDEKVRKKFIDLFNDDRATNPDYDYIAKLFQQFRKMTLGNRNGNSMFKRLVDVVNGYINSGHGKAILQEYNANYGSSHIFCIVTGLMCRMHEKILQTGEICHVDASSSFNTSITLFYTGCMIDALPLGLFITSDENEATLKNAIDLLGQIEEIDISEGNASKFILFLENVKNDYQNVSFLYGLNYQLDPTANIRSGSMIRVQVESMKRCKLGLSNKCRLPAIENKENLDPQVIPNRKKRKANRKEHDLSKRINKKSIN